MRLTEIALAITLVLLAVTGYLAYEGHKDRFNADDRDAPALQANGGSVEQRLAAIERQMANMRQDQVRQARDQPREIAADPDDLRLPPPPPLLGATNGSGPMPGPTAPSGLRPDSLADSADEPPPLTDLERRVLRAPSIARVTSYDLDHNILEISGGSTMGIKEGMEFSIRRDQYLLGTMRVNLVDDDAAAGEMYISSMPDGLVVEPGDEVIERIAANP